jgi:hypothetical protein
MKRVLQKVQSLSAVVKSTLASAMPVAFLSLSTLAYGVEPDNRRGQQTCENLASLQLLDSQITAAASIQAGIV